MGLVLLSLSLLACGEATDSGTRSLVTANPTTQAAATTEASTSTNQAVATASPTAQPQLTGAVNTSTAAASSTTTAAATQSGTAANGPLSDQLESNSVVSVVKQLNPAVVTVYNKTKYSPTRAGGLPTPSNRPTPTPGGETSPNGFVVQGIGSGVIISSDGYIITNEHVVDGQDDLAVALNDGKANVPAKLIGKDRLGDISIIKIEGPVPGYAKWADRAEIGETVIAIGAALGNFRNSVSKGVISGLNRTLPGDPGNGVYVQTDAAINHGNSGGPLLNLRGEIVGINTAVLRSTGPGRTQRGQADVAEGLGFAIPAGIARILAEQLMTKGQVVRPYFGISYQMITPADAGTLSVSGRAVPAVEGAWVSRTNNQSGIVKGGPADKAGLKDDDVITAINGDPLNDNNPLVNVILKYKPNDTVKLTVRRDNQTLTLNLTLAERPADQ